MLGELIAIFAVLTFVGSNVIFRKTEHEVSPTFINFFRTGIGTLTFIFIALILNQLNLVLIIPWELWLILIISFIFGQVIGDTAYFSAQKELGTTIALAISMTFPLFTFMLSLIFLNRPFKLNLVFSLILISIGITTIGKSKINSENSKLERNSVLKRSIKFRIQEIFNKDIIKAIGFCITASLGWAIGAVIIEFATIQIDQIIHTKELSSIIGNVIRFPFAFLILGSMVLRENHLMKRKENPPSQKKSLRSLIILLIASIIGTSLGAYLYTESVHIAGANVVSLIASASPLFALPLTYFVNKEKISKFGVVGVVLTIFGVVIILI
ncbi:MAG: DMT family transporter [Promethearchaeota archaeon]|nr:MAG: DMT family transporter [Candidatus Lokiarchaeota archaeon]